MNQLTRIEAAVRDHGDVFSPSVDLTRARELAAQIDIKSPLTVTNFGAEIGKAAGNYADELLQQARSNDLDDMGSKLNEVVVAAQSFDLDAFDSKWTRMPLIGGLIGSIARTKARTMANFSSLEGQIEKLVGDIASAQIRLAHRAQTLDTMYKGVEEEHFQLALHASAAAIRLQELNDELQSLRLSASSPMEVELLASMEASASTLSKRVGDLSVLQHSALQTLPMIRMIQANNLVLIEKFQTIQNLTVPAWKRAFMMALALHEQKDAVALANNIDDATNYFMRRNSEILHENAVATARANQRLVVDVETLRLVHENVIKTLTDVRKANLDGQVQREQALTELVKLRADMQRSLVTPQTPPSLPLQ
jgi:uncharacterized protein YaaN involved in tellurite resistance